jgi:23S rRNA (adenine2503-C2)-methyltransferase
MNPIPQVLRSEEDLSVNFVFDNGLEARYVRRTNADYAIVYLSSHRGCNQACRFCHLTQTKQVDLIPATIDEMLLQATLVLKHYEDEVKSGKQTKVDKLHFNWMARGEPLLNDELSKKWYMITRQLNVLCRALGVERKAFNFSTIMPEGGFENYHRYLDYGEYAPTIFYSLYSMDSGFRDRWLPKAMRPQVALALLKQYQLFTDNHVVLHWAFIEGENDSEEDVYQICDAVADSGVMARFNLVRYNPYSEVQGKESSEEVLQARFDQICQVMKLPGSRIVPRVGRDVAASCGTFINIKAAP